MQRALVTGLTLILILGCGGGGGKGGKGKAKKAPAPSAAPAAPAAKEVQYTLESVDEAEIACFFTLRNAKGKSQKIRATFDLCPQGDDVGTPLVGKKVKVSIGRGSEPAPSCGGDFECPDTVEVDLVEKISAI